MKLLKKFVLTSLLLFISICAFTNFSQFKSENQANAVFDNQNFTKYIKIFSGNELSNSNIIKEDNNNFSIVSNNSVSFALNLFEYKFTFHENFFDENSNPFKITYSSPIVLEEDIGELEISFDNKINKYYYEISPDGKLSLYTSSLRLPSSLKISGISNNFEYGISFNSMRELTYIKNVAYTCKDNQKTLTFNVYDNKIQSFNFNFLKPITKFSNQEEQIVLFSCYGHDAGENIDGYNPTWLPSERIFNSVTIKFFRNYTEQNPLFFNVNLNGFIYYYKIFTNENGITMQYIDGETITEKTYNVLNSSLAKENTLDFEFTSIGRYEIEIYDLTYNTNLSKEENYSNNANYYSTSFYIYDDTKTYENIYLVSQSYENGNPLEYIVSNNSQTAATLNNDIHVTFKNLYFLSRENFERIRITITKTYFTGSVSSTVTEYTHANNEFLNECYLNQEDFYLDFTEDARYKINVYFGNISTPLISTSYEVVKQPKTLFQVGNEGDPYYDRYVETNPYTKTEKTYTVPLSSQISFYISYINPEGNLTLESKANSTFNKTFLNKFTIFFGISQVNISKYTRILEDDSVATTLDIKIQGVGKVNVTVTFNNEKTYYTFEEKENKVLSFSEYGTYKIDVVDEMGTTGSKSFSYQKTLNTSAFLLIGLSSILVLGVVIFILRSRSRVATR